MSETTELNPFEGFVFYVNESGEDFTFYLDVNANCEVLKRLKGLPKDGTNQASDRYSFVGEISFVDDAGLKTISNLFWARLETSAGKYLLERLRNLDSESEAEGAASNRQLLSRPEQLDKHQQERLLPLLAQALSGATLEGLKRFQRGESATTTVQPEELDAGQIQSQSRFFEVAFPEGQEEIRRGRGLICLSHAGKYLSVSVRMLRNEGSYEAALYGKEDQGERRRNLFSLGEYCDLIYDEIFARTNSTNSAHGLLVITGSTNSAKSEIARGLIDRYLFNQEKRKRRHHLVTFEDPIEKFYVDESQPRDGKAKGHARVVRGPAFVSAAMKAKAIDKDYTPREKTKDVGKLSEALQDALRQTPSILFVGETRRKDEWELLLDFAATGHLIVTTAHAASLVEAMHKIFEARKVKTPADRSEIANKLLGVVHLGSHQLRIIPQGFRADDFILPANQPKSNSTTICAGERFATAHKLLVDWLSSGESGARPNPELANELNKLIDNDRLHDDEVFKELDQSKEIQRLRSLPPTKRTSRTLNRLLMEALYSEIPRRRLTPRTLFPALWRRTARGVAGLTSDGLSSLLPHRPGEDKTEVPSCLGRRWIIEQLIEGAGDLRPTFAEDESESLREQSYRKAIEWDLQGV